MKQMNMRFLAVRIACMMMPMFSLGREAACALERNDENNMPRIRCDGEQRFETVRGEPFFPVADTAWLLVRLLNEDIEYYVHERSKQGFNVIKFGPESAEVDLPKLDFILDTLARYGMYAELYIPAYDYNADELILDNYTFAGLIAKAFLKRSNIFAYTLEGLDSPHAKNNLESMRQLLLEAYRGIRSVDPHRLITFHPRSGRSVVQHSGIEPEYMDFYSVHKCNPGSIHDLVHAEVKRTPRKPVFLSEPVYEGRGAMCGCNHGCTADQVLEQIEEALLVGVAGISYGHYSIWSFNHGTDGKWGVDPSPEGLPWREALVSPGAQGISEIVGTQRNPLLRMDRSPGDLGLGTTP